MDNTRRPGGGGSKKKKWMQRVSRGKLFLLVSTTRQRHFSEKWKQEISHTPVLLSCWRWKSIDNQRTRKEGRKLYTQLRLDGVCVWLLALQESRSNQHGRGARLLMNFSGLGLLFHPPTVRDWIDRLDFVYIIRNGGTAGNWGRKKEQTEKCNQIKS